MKSANLRKQATQSSDNVVSLFAKQKAKEAQAAREQFFAALRAENGSERRKRILAYLEDNPGTAIAVNNKWQLSTEQDSDLSRLIKQGKLVRYRDGGSRRSFGHRKSSKRQTYLVLVGAEQERKAL
jgi:hypothetical protein